MLQIRCLLLSESLKVLLEQTTFLASATICSRTALIPISAQHVKPRGERSFPTVFGTFTRQTQIDNQTDRRADVTAQKNFLDFHLSLSLTDAAPKTFLLSSPFVARRLSAPNLVRGLADPLNAGLRAAYW